ncbi:transposase [Streptomyces sp. NPDC020192]|uniref:transposase n=1 Tax=Streptomyces sp. NPDC020192 TaxID=3365066 RepID=UPI0037A5ECBF
MVTWCPRAARRMASPPSPPARSTIRRDRASQRGDKAAVHALRQQVRRLPSADPDDPDYRRLRYIRYADDWLLRDLQARVRSEQQTSEWKARHAVRSGVEGTINEFAHGHGMRRCRYRGQPKAHLQHVLTAIAVNIERLSGLTPVEEPPSPRPPTAFQAFLDQHEIPRSKSWRTLSSRPQPPRSPTESS